MAQEYTVTQFKIGDFQDNYGNTWCDMAIQGFGEPVRIVVKDPLSVKEGDTLYGEIKEMTSKAGKPYNRFYREQREDAQQQNFGTKKEWQPRDDAAIKAQFAIKAAIAYQPAGAPIKDVEEAAKSFYEMVNRVKGVSPQTEIPTSGYEKAKATANTLRVNEEEDVDAEYESLVKSAYNSDNIDLSEIPF